MQDQNTTEIVHQRCATCRERKPESDFWKEVRTPTGRPYWRCKQCERARYKLWRDRNVDRIRGATVESKQCQRCKQTKHGSDFSKDRHSKDGLDFRCRDCKAEMNHHYHRFGTRAPMHLLWSMYRLRKPDYDKILAGQDGKCAICKKHMEMVCIDHDHQTGKVRGMLCTWCNAMMAGIDREGFVEAARRYTSRDLSEVPGRAPLTARSRRWMSFMQPPIPPE